MTIIEELNEVKQLHDEYAEVRFDNHNPTDLINLFHKWHGLAATLFSRYLPSGDVELLKFKTVEEGDSTELATQFDAIETSYCILVSKLLNSVSVKLEELIIEGEKIASTILYVPPRSNVIRSHAVYSIGQDPEYHVWKNKSIRLLEISFKRDGSLDRFKEAAMNFDKSYYTPKYMSDMIGILKACVDIPAVDIPSTINNLPSVQSPVTINVNQNQSQTQSIAIDIFFDSIKDEITGKQFKELKTMANNQQEPSEVKSRVLEKVKSFGNDVLSNIVANIITNPVIWSGLK